VCVDETLSTISSSFLLSSKRACRFQCQRQVQQHEQYHEKLSHSYAKANDKSRVKGERPFRVRNYAFLLRTSQQTNMPYKVKDKYNSMRNFTSLSTFVPMVATVKDKVRVKKRKAISARALCLFTLANV
jgi:hypothetical protein